MLSSELFEPRPGDLNAAYIRGFQALDEIAQAYNRSPAEFPGSTGEPSHSLDDAAPSSCVHPNGGKTRDSLSVSPRQIQAETGPFPSSCNRRWEVGSPGNLDLLESDKPWEILTGSAVFFKTQF